MHEVAERLAGRLLTAEDELAREFEARLADSSRVALRVAFSVLRHREDAEDVAQDAFVRAHRGFSRLRDRDRFRAWIVRTAWRLASDRRRGDLRRERREQAPTDAPVPPTPEAEMLLAERSTRMWSAIDALPEKLRLVLILASIEEHSIDEVATLVGIPTGTVKSRLFEARRQLQERLR